MGILVVTNRFELGMLDESITKTRGLAIGSPEMYDAQNLFAEYVNRPFHRACVEIHTDNTYESEHKNFYYRKALDVLSRGNHFVATPMIHWGSYVFQEGDHIMVIKTNYDPVFSGDDFDPEFHIKVYLFSF